MERKMTQFFEVNWWLFMPLWQYRGCIVNMIFDGLVFLFPLLIPIKLVQKKQPFIG